MQENHEGNRFGFGDAVRQKINQILGHSRPPLSPEAQRLQAELAMIEAERRYLIHQAGGPILTPKAIGKIILDGAHTIVNLKQAEALRVPSGELEIIERALVSEKTATVLFVDKYGTVIGHV